MYGFVRRVGIAIVCGIFCTSGAASAQAMIIPARLVAQLTMAVATNAELIAAASRAEEQYAKTEPKSELTWLNVRARVMANNPDVRVTRWEIPAAEGRVEQSATRPNPELSVGVEDVRISPSPREQETTLTLEGSRTFDPSGIAIEGPPIVGHQRSDRLSRGFGGAGFAVSLSYEVELGGKRQKRMAAAHEDLTVAKADYERTSAQAIQLAAKRYADVLAAQDRLKLAQSRAALLDNIIEGAGGTNEEDIDLERQRTQMQLRVRQREFRSARIRLAELWGAPRPDFAKIVGELASLPPVHDLKHSLEQLDQHPGLRRTAAALDHRNALVKLERAQAVPNLTMELGYKMERLQSERAKAVELTPFSSAEFSRETTGYSGEAAHFLEFSVSMPLPIFDRNRGRIKEARSLAEQARELTAGAAARAASELRAAYNDFESIRAQIAFHEETLLPRAQERCDEVIETYRSDASDWAPSLDSRDALMELMEEQISLYVQAHHLVADINFLTGSFSAGPGLDSLDSAAGGVEQK